MKKIIVYFILLLFLFPLIGISTANAEDLKTIGSLCTSGTSNNECASDDCEESTKTDQDKTLSYCDCDDEQDCVDAYGDVKENWICKDGANSTWDLDYCLNQDVEKTQFPIPTKKTGSISEIVADLLLDSSAVTTQLYSEIDNIVKKPQPKITIPGLSFSEGKTVEEPDGSYLYIPFLGEYIGAIYKYLVIIASIIAVAMIIKNAFDWVISAGEAAKITQAKTRIGQSIMGLVIAVGSYFILYTINPNLVEFKNLRVRYVERIELSNTPDFDTGADPASVSFPTTLAQGAVPCDFPEANGLKKIPPLKGIKYSSKYPNQDYLLPEVIKALEEVGKLADKEGYIITITTACRNLSIQTYLTDKDKNSAGQKLGTLAKKGKSPHGFGTAVDVYLSKDGKPLTAAVVGGGVNYAQCKHPEVMNDFQKLANFFLQAGWVRLTIETWHFEYGTAGKFCRGTCTGYASLCNQTGANDCPAHVNGCKN